MIMQLSHPEEGSFKKSRDQVRERFFLKRSIRIESKSQATPDSKVQEGSFVRYVLFLQFLPSASHLNDLINTLILRQPQIIFLLNIRTHKSMPN
jgi:hypothetical protein